MTRLARWLHRRGPARNARTAAAWCCVVCPVAVTGSAAGMRAGDHGWWVGGALAAAGAAMAGFYLLGYARGWQSAQPWAGLADAGYETRHQPIDERGEST